MKRARYHWLAAIALACNVVLYKERHGVECTFGKLKHYRRMATRYEKTACHYMGMLSFAAVLLWLREQSGKTSTEPSTGRTACFEQYMSPDQDCAARS